MIKTHLLVILVLPFTIASVYATSYANIHLNLIGGILAENSNVTFSGTLAAPDGTPISNRTVFIEDDTNYMRPNIILAITTTNSDGKFFVSWKAVPKDNGSPFHFFSEFLGGRAFGFTRSETYESEIKLNNQPTHEMVPSKTIPAWFLDASKLWHDGKIRDVDYVYGIKNLVDYQIIKANYTSDLTSIPSWVRTDAGLLSDGTISIEEYQYMLGYLINHKIIK